MDWLESLQQHLYNQATKITSNKHPENETGHPKSDEELMFAFQEI